MPSRRHIQVSEEIARLAAAFFARGSNHTALITVTRADVAPDFKQATVYLSILPQSAEKEALASMRRERSDFREYVNKHSALHPLPFFEFTLDYGEKNRQRVDELTRKQK